MKTLKIFVSDTKQLKVIVHYAGKFSAYTESSADIHQTIIRRNYLLHSALCDMFI